MKMMMHLRPPLWSGTHIVDALKHPPYQPQDDHHRYLDTVARDAMMAW